MQLLMEPRAVEDTDRLWRLRRRGVVLNLAEMYVRECA